MRTGLDQPPDAAAWRPMSATDARMAPGDWEPFWIGPRPRTLYGALHRAGSAPGTGVVMASPLLDELPRSRRFVTEVAAELATSGVPVLRFDYYGTGDSEGHGDEADFDSMRDDIDRAITALRARTGVSRVVLVAWRGAALVVDAWLAQGGCADLVVWWDPLRDGASWLRNLEAADAKARAELPPPRPGVPRTVEREDGQLMGFRVSGRLRGELAAARVRTDAGSFLGPRWAILHAGDAVPGADRTFFLPSSAARLASGATMDSTLFLTPQVREFVRALAPALVRGGVA